MPSIMGLKGLVSNFFFIIFNFDQTDDISESNRENTLFAQKNHFILPWIPEINNKFRKCFKSADVRIIFKI